MVWQDKLILCCRIQFYAESALPISQKLSSNKMSFLSRVFWPWTALGTARISTRRRRQKAGREVSAVSSLKQHGLPKMKENPHLPTSKEGKSTRFLTEIKAFHYCQELYITCWLALFLVDCLLVDLTSRISPSLRGKNSQVPPAAFTTLTSAAGTGSPGEGWKDTQPLLLGKKGSAGNI